MKTGSVRSNNNNNPNNLNNNKIYADKFEVIENISNNNNLNSNPPQSIDLLNYSNNNVYADIVDLDDTETLSLMYSQNAQQQFDRGRPISSTKKPYDESFYLANSSSRSFDKPYHPHAIQDHRRHYSSSDINYLQHPQQRPHSQNSYYSRHQNSIKDFSNNSSSSSVQSPLALHSTNNIQTAQVTNKHSLNKSNSVSSSSAAYSSNKMSSNKHMANEKHTMPSNARVSGERASKNVNSNSKRKIISPEEVLQLFSVQQQPSHQHPHLSGFLGRHHPNNSTVSNQQQQHSVQNNHQQGPYLQSASRQRTSSGSSIINEHHRGRKSPSSASSPPTMTHQLYRDRTMIMRDQHMSHSIPNINQLATRTINLKRSDSTKAPNLSLPLNKTSSASHHSHGSTSKSKEATTGAHVKEDPNHNGFGICIKGNKSTGRGVLITKVEIGSSAYLAGLRGGDAILEINGIPFTHLHQEEAAKKCTAILKAEKFCSMTIRSPDMGTTMKYNSFDESQLSQHHHPHHQQQQSYVGAHEEELYIPVPHHDSLGADSGSIHSAPLKVGCLWIDRHGRSVSPPHEYSHRRIEKMDRVRRIDLLIEPGQSLGLMIRGGIEYGLGIFVTGVDKDSVAERAGLMIGDQILEVNNRSFLEITHDEAVNLLKCHKRMTLLIRDIGKIPYSCSYNNNNSYPQSSSSWHAGDTMTGRPFNTTLQKAIKKNSGISSIEEKARALLSRNHLLNLIHNISEYGAKRNMDIETFVTILLELLDTPEKHSLVSEIRDIIYPEDRLRFDELMFRHGVTVNLLSNNVATLYGRSGGGFKNRLGIRGNNDQYNHSGLHSGSYFDGIRSITQRLQSWYFGRPLSRQQLRNVPHHHEEHDRARDNARKQPNEFMSANVHQNSDGNLLVSIPKTRASIGIAIEGGANTKHPLPRIINIHENGAAFDAGGLEVGQLILEVDNHKIEGMQHEDIARLIAESYSNPDRHFITFLVSESKKSNLEPKSTALIYLETIIVIIHFCLNVIFLIL